MSSCNGDGTCLKQCECYDEEIEEYDEVCVCGHREHNGYCPSNCCTLVECRNFKHCRTKIPQWVTFCHNGMHANCAIQMGNHKYTNEVEDCCVCLENKTMLILKCNHKICNDCWYIITKEGLGNDNRRSLCPLCRNRNNWS